MAMTYEKYRPTGFDCAGLGLDERQDWLVVPVGRNRDSGCLDESNFAVALQLLGGESDTVEVHRFGHWGCGWFEIIVVHPDRADVVDEIQRSLDNYPILDDEHHSGLEWDRACNCWERARVSDRVEWCRRFDVSIFAARRDEIPQDDNGSLMSYLAE